MTARATDRAPSPTQVTDHRAMRTPATAPPKLTLPYRRLDSAPSGRNLGDRPPAGRQDCISMFDAIDDNVSQFLVEMGRAGGGLQRHDDEVTWTVGGSPIDYHNAVVRCAAHDADRAAVLARQFLQNLQARGIPGSWHLHPGMTPPNLADVLLREGYDDGGSEPAMAMRLHMPLPAPVGNLSIEVVRDAGGFERYRHVLADGFGEGPKEADWVTSIFRTIGVEDDRWRHFVGSLGGEAVSTTTIFRTGAVAGVYFVATRPAFRRQGFGSAITTHGLNDARARGANAAVLASSPMGRHIYEELGFREHFHYQLFEAHP
jgi:ribosomal protein S18 acetylase RimI-like enzyme